MYNECMKCRQRWELGSPSACTCDLGLIAWGADDVRYLHKWCNEETAAPIDRAALARVLHQLAAWATVVEEREGWKEPTPQEAKGGELTQHAQSSQGTASPVVVGFEPMFVEDDGRREPSLHDTIAALVKERDELKQDAQLWAEFGDEVGAEQLAALQAREAKLREALEHYVEYGGDGPLAKARDALSQPHDDTALRQAIAKELRDMAEILVTYDERVAALLLIERAEELEGQ